MHRHFASRALQQRLEDDTIRHRTSLHEFKRQGSATRTDQQSAPPCPARYEQEQRGRLQTWYASTYVSIWFRRSRFDVHHIRVSRRWKPCVLLQINPILAEIFVCDEMDGLKGTRKIKIRVLNVTGSVANDNTISTLQKILTDKEH